YERMRPTFIAAALQANINENVKWTPPYVARARQTFIGLSRVAQARGAALTVWPETAFPARLLTDFATRPAIQAECVRDHQTMVIGSVEYDALKDEKYNSLFLMDPSGNITGA